MYRQRPTGVTLIAVFFFIAGAGSLLSGVLVMAVPIPSVAQLTGTGGLVTFQIVVALLGVVLGALQIATGWGLWNLRDWARIAAIVILGLNAIGNLSSGIGLLIGVNLPLFGRLSLPGYGVLSLLVAGLMVWMIWYLFQPDVEMLFTGFAPPREPEPSTGSTIGRPRGSEVDPPVESRPRREPTVPIHLEPAAEGWLVLRSGSRIGQQFGLQRGRNTVGRNPARADILLQDETVSGEHACVKYEHGQFYVYDLASKNGTYVNSRRVQKHMLMDGDSLRLGNESLIFKRV